MSLQLGYLSLWGIFRFIFRQLRMTKKLMSQSQENFRTEGKKDGRTKGQTANSSLVNIILKKFEFALT